MNRLLTGNLNINFKSNKFDQLKLFVRGKVDTLVITGTKLDSTFPTSQFLIEGYNEPYRFDRNRTGGGVLIYVREGISSKLLTDSKSVSFVELNLTKYTFLLFGSYHPPSQSDKYFFNHVKNGLDIYSKFYYKYTLVEDLNTQGSESCKLQFLFEMNAKNIAMEPTCLKSLSSPSCIDLAITNSSSKHEGNINGLIRFS